MRGNEKRAPYAICLQRNVNVSDCTTILVLRTYTMYNTTYEKLGELVTRKESVVVLTGVVVTILVLILLIAIIRSMRREQTTGFYDLVAAEMRRGGGYTRFE